VSYHREPIGSPERNAGTRTAVFLPPVNQSRYFAEACFGAGLLPASIAWTDARLLNEGFLPRLNHSTFQERLFFAMARIFGDYHT
jgi:hypothetical protein